MNQLNLTHFFFYHYFILIFLALAFIWVMERSGHSLRRSWKLSLNKIKGYTKEFYSYSHPLFVYALVGLIVGILDRWMLQKFAGSVEQGFYGLSYQIGAVCFLFTSAMTPLITREFAIAFGEKDLREMARLFRRYSPMLYAIAAYFACFIAVQADKVTFIMGGEKFQHAALAVMIMAFYPIHQTYGQLSGSVFYATGQTALYRNIGVAFMLIGLPVTYLLIAPGHMLGLNAGATGLAIKMVVLQFIGVNVQLWFNTRLLKLRFWRYVGHQIVSVGCLLGVAAISMLVVDKGLGLQNKVVLSFFLSGVFYTLMTGVLGYAQPVLFGLQRRDIRNLLNRGLKK
jgi:O-antigen/teichoic acid export membrane protein